MMPPNRKRIAHAKIEIGNSELMLAEEFPEMNSLSPKTISGRPVGLFLYVDDFDKLSVKQLPGSKGVDGS